MSDTKILIYLCVGVGVALFLIFRPPKRKEPSKLKMKDKKPDSSNASQIEGARWVAAENVEVEGEQMDKAQWVNPTIVHKGKVLDAYSVLESVPGSTLEHLRSQADALLKKASSASETKKIKSALSAIESAMN